MNLITNRTQADVDRLTELASKGFANMTATEKAEWLAGMKGAYNYTDLNRVETAVRYLAELLGVTVTVKTDWEVTDIPSQTDMARYLSNIRSLRKVNSALSTTPSVPDSMANLTYKTANDIEQILLDIEARINSWFRCNEIFCGEV